jgi:hypothetical protein
MRPRPAPSRRSRGSNGEPDETESRDDREEQYDLLTAALIGLVVGVGATALLKRGPRGRRPIGPFLRGARRGAAWAGRQGARGARWAAERGGELWERVPREEIQEQVEHYLDAARDSISDVVESELRDLRKAIRRRRKRLGI